MTAFLPYVYGFIGGAIVVAGWWWWIGHRAKVKALEQAALAAAKKV
jgi:hypothetical protein